MFKSTFLLTVAVFICATLSAQQLGEFPKMEGENLKSQSVRLPDDVKGKYTIIGVAYSKKAMDALQSWSEPVYYEFIDQSSMTAMVYDVNVYLVMLFTGAKKAVYSKAKQKIKSETAEKLWEHTFLLKANLATYEESLKLKDKATPVFFVLDENGSIVHFESGFYSKSKFKKITDLVEN